MKGVNITFKSFWLIGCFLLSLTTGFSQQVVITAKQYHAKADEAFQRRDFNTALAYYTTILKDDSLRSDLYWNTAEAARQTRRFALAERYYELAARSGVGIKQPMLDYNLALTKKTMGKYDEAIEAYQRYRARNPNSSNEAAVLADIEQIQWAKLNSKAKKYEVTHLDTNVNTIYMDIAPVQIGNLLYYTRSSDKPFDVAPVANVFATNFQEKALPLSINVKEGNFHTAHYAPNTEGSRLYHNVCANNETGGIDCQLYVREKGADGTWAKAILLDSSINAKGKTTTQPNVGFDRVKNKDVLYFSSNRYGGKGGMDIWAVDIEPNGRLGVPYNVSAVNTDRDDISPFFMSAQQVLLFSTEGGQNGFGGFDIHKTIRIESGFSPVENLGYPLNSSYDEMYPSFAGDLGRYYFVSNRPGGMCATDDSACVCNDIYMQQIKASIDVTTLYAGLNGNEKLNGVKLELWDIESNKVVKLDMNPDGSTYFFPLEINRKYRLIGSKEGFVGDTIEFDTKNLSNPVNMMADELNLKSAVKLDIYTFDQVTRKALNSTIIEIYSMDGKLLATKKPVIGNNWQWEGAQYGQSYRIVANKETYEKDEKTILIETIAKASQSVYRVDLYLKPFSGLPLLLYFDNDCPDPRSREMTTDLTYDDTYIDYISRQPIYLSSSPAEERDTVMNFFARRVSTGYEKLISFGSLLTQYLSAGYGMEIVLEGYASPLADPNYNRILTSRRISSVINHFYRYQGGIFQQYIRKGQLRLKVEPYGSAKAASDVSADPRDRKKSVFSVKAMNERKVHLLEINRFEYNASEVFNLGEALGMYFDADALGLKKIKATTTKGGSNKAKVRLPKAEATVEEIVTPKSVRRKSKNVENTEGVQLGVSYDTPVSYSSNARSKTTKKAAKQLYQVVFVDSYTGTIINNSASVDLYDQQSEKLIGKAKRRKNSKGYVYSLDYNRDYLVKGSVAGYGEAQSTEYISETSEGSIMRTDTMYLQPFQGLPLSLYFDNNRPVGAGTEVGVTYDQTYRDFATKKFEFIKMYNKMTDAAGGLPVSPNEMSLFFDAEVRGGYQRLVGFSGILKNYLSRGYQLEIIVAGYASPLADNDYNRKLSERRVKSVINHFNSFSGGALSRYIKTGQLKITIEPMGEISNYVSDDASQTSSIYSLEASRERRVVIKDIVILNTIFEK